MRSKLSSMLSRSAFDAEASQSCIQMITYHTTKHRFPSYARIILEAWTYTHYHTPPIYTCCLTCASSAPDSICQVRLFKWNVTQTLLVRFRDHDICSNGDAYSLANTYYHTTINVYIYRNISIYKEMLYE